MTACEEDKSLCIRELSDECCTSSTQIEYSLVDEEAIVVPDIPADFYSALADWKTGRVHDLNVTLEQEPEAGM